MTKEEMEAMIKELEKEQEELVSQANQRIAYLSGKIELLNSLLASSEDAVKTDE